MSSFMGGSAYAMANQIAQGFIMVTASTIRKLRPPDRKTLDSELEKILREIRGETPPIDDTQALQKRNRRMSRINQAKLIIKNAV